MWILTGPKRGHDDFQYWQCSGCGKRELSTVWKNLLRCSCSPSRAQEHPRSGSMINGNPASSH